MARFTKGKTFTSTEQVTSTKLHQLIDDAAIAIDTFNIIWPVGSVYTSVLSTNPNTLFGFGTWSAFGAGRTLVGLDAGQTEFDTVEETGGSKAAIVVSHTHTASSVVTDPGHTHPYTFINGGVGPQSGSATNCLTNPTSTGGTTSSATTGITVATTVDSAGSAGTNANLQPYIVVYFWKRTA